MYGRKYFLLKGRRRHKSHNNFMIVFVLVLSLSGLFLYLLYEIFKHLFDTDIEYFTYTHIVRETRIEKPSVLYLDHTGFILADEQPDYHKEYTELKTSGTRKIHKKSFVHHSDKNNPIEYDPSIDDGAVQESYKWYLQKKDSAVQCTYDKPIRRLVFLRLHRVASHTIANIFYRYGTNNNLYFALPNSANFQFYWPLRFHHSHVDKSLLGKSPPDFLINIARNDFNRIKAYAKETFTVAVLRDPVTHFESIYDYIDMDFFLKQISNSSNYFSVLSADPSKYISKIINGTKMFDPLFHLLKNGQLFDLGYEKKDYDTRLKLDFLIRDLQEQVDLFIILEYLDESLVLLKQLLCWDLTDVAYFKQRVRRKRRSITDETKESIKRWNKEDVYLYNYFNETLWNELNSQDETFWSEVKKLKELSSTVKKSCVEIKDFNMDNLTGGTLQNSNLTSAKAENYFEIKYIRKKIDNEDLQEKCSQFLQEEKEYIRYLKKKQKQFLHDNATEFMKGKYYMNKTEKNFWYTLSNSSLQSNIGNLANDKTDEVENENEAEVQEIMLIK